MSPVLFYSNFIEKWSDIIISLYLLISNVSLKEISLTLTKQICSSVLTNFEE